MSLINLRFTDDGSLDLSGLTTVQVQILLVRVAAEAARRLER